MTRLITPLRISRAAAAVAATALATLAGCSANTDDLFNEDGDGSSGSGGSGATGGESTSGGAAGSGATGGSGGTTAACEPTRHELPQRKTYFEFVIDTSGSMEADIPDGAPGPDRLQGTLASLARSFANFPPSAFVGATLFPGLENTSEAQCYAAEQNVPFTRALDATGAIVDVYRPPSGGTPTHNAVHFGLEQLRKISPLDGDRYLFIITDGAGNYGIGDPNDIGRQCIGDGMNRNSVDQGGVLEEIRAAHDDEQIYTLAVGLPGSWSSYSDILSQMSRLGGTPLEDCVQNPNFACHLNLDNGTQDFRKGLIEVAGYLGEFTASCGFRLPPGADPERLEIKYNDTKQLQYSENCDGGGGEGYTTAFEGHFVYLCQQACDAYLSESGKVTATLLCP